MVEIRRYVEGATNATDKQRKHAVRIGVARVLAELIDCRSVTKHEDRYAVYRWGGK